MISLFGLAFFPSAGWGNSKMTVCTVSITSELTANTFKRKLGTKDFDHVELTSHHQSGDADRSGWFQRACESGVQCDVLVIAGHFAGTFFAKSSRRDAELALSEMEERSCSNTCDGILKRPREVFLMGCNTLAPKFNEHRSREQVIQVYVEDGFTRQEAERRAAILFSPMGSAYQDRMRRVFKGAGNLYGFDAASPASPRIQPFLEKYFSKIPDYKDHLMKKYAEQIAGQAHAANDLLAKNMLGAFTQCHGILPSDPDFEMSQKLCAIYDERRSLKDRLLVAQDLLSGPDRITALPSLFRFFRKISALGPSKLGPEETAILNTLRQNKALRGEVLDLRGSLQDTPEMQLQLNVFLRDIGWISKEDSNTFFETRVREWARNPDEFKSYLGCTFRSDHAPIALRMQDFGEGALTNIHGVEFAACFSSRDPQVATLARQTLENQTDYPMALKVSQFARLASNDPESIDWILGNLSQVPESSRFSLLHGLSGIKSDHPGLREFFRKMASEQTSGSMEALKWIGQSGIRDEQNLRVLLQASTREGFGSAAAMQSLRDLNFEDPQHQLQIIRTLKTVPTDRQRTFTTVISAMDLKTLPAGVVANYVVDPAINSEVRSLLLTGLTRKGPIPDVVLFNLSKIRSDDPLYSRIQSLLPKK